MGSDKTLVILKKLGINPANLGWTYLKDAINLCVDDPRFLNNISTLVYGTVAKMNNSTPARVERCIRHDISKGMRMAPLKSIRAVFGYCVPANYHITNSQFIATCVEVINEEPDNPIWSM